MTSDSGDASSRLSSALEEILSGRGSADSDDAPPDGIPGEPYVLPEIVPATVETPAVESPRLPDREPGSGAATAEAPVVGAAAQTAARAVVAGPATAPVARTEPNGPAPAAVAGWGDSGASGRSVPPAGWSDYVPAARTQLRALGRRPRVRRVTRVLRHIDPWSAFKIAVLFNAVAYVVCLTSGVLLWRVADSTGTLDNVERWFTQFGWETFELKGEEIFRDAWVIGLFAVVAATGAAVLLVTLFNLVSDIVGGIRLTVLEEEVVERTISSTRRYVVRRPGDVAASGAAVADWSTDDLDADAGVPDGAAAAEPPTPTEPARPSATEWSVD